MHLSTHAIAAGLAALSLGAAAAPAAFAKGGGDINNTVVSISPNAPLPATNSGGGGSGKPQVCTIVSVDPVTGSSIATCTTARP
jgi:hypothetical protein